MLLSRPALHLLVEVMTALAVVGICALSHRARDVSATVLRVAAIYLTTTRG
jgi:hypothetical protein